MTTKWRGWGCEPRAMTVTQCMTRFWDVYHARKIDATHDTLKKQKKERLASSTKPKKERNIRKRWNISRKKNI